MRFTYCGKTYTFRSAGLLRFLRILKDAHPEKLDLATLQMRMPGTAPRQIARFIDLLEAQSLALVAYQTKTRGSYFLNVDPVTLEMGDAVSALTPSVSSAPMSYEGLAVYQKTEWVEWTVALAQSILSSQCGDFSKVCDYLDIAEGAASSLPAWTLSVVYARRVHQYERESRYREAAHCLRRIETAARDGLAHPGALTRARLSRAKMRYDQGRLDDAERILASCRSMEGARDPMWLNFNALLHGRRFLKSKTDGDLLAKTFAALSESLGYVFLLQGDISLLNALSYNFGNNILRGVQAGLFSQKCSDIVLQWLAANLLICRKFGVGEDSILSNLLIVDVALEFGMHTGRWPALLHQEIKMLEGLEAFLNQSLLSARAMGNRLEIAQCLRRQARLAKNSVDAKSAHREAMELFAELGRKDLMLEMKQDAQFYAGAANQGH
ncbi:MAG: hypothetical protein HYZ65_14675 [Burkholderiales bacterium]|nr:hypothetical protein [Burkholderiales bacterium]